MTTLEKYFELKQKWCGAQNDEEYDSFGKALVDFRDNNFTKSDWEELIGQSSGRAKYEYTRMMNEKFPPKSEDDIPDDVMALYGAKEG